MHKLPGALQMESGILINNTHAGSPGIGYLRFVQRPDGEIVTIYYFWDKKT